jgi:type VI secretion system protein ImpH
MATASRGTSTPLNLEESAMTAKTAPTGAASSAHASAAHDGAPGFQNPSASGMTVEKLLYDEGFGFDFFQAVRLIEKLNPKRIPVGRAGPPRDEAVRFRAHMALSFPASQIFDIFAPRAEQPIPLMTVTFLGLTGPSGVLPHHYTEMLLRLDRESKGKEKHAFRDWLDLFNHRLISLFFRAWEKYRFYIPYERKEYSRYDTEDPFTRALFSMIGLGAAPLRNRLHVATWQDEGELQKRRVLAQVDDLSLAYYGAFLSHRPRNSLSLEAFLKDYFQLPVRVLQFQGQWLVLDPANQSKMGVLNGNNSLGVNLVAGERVWDVQSKIRIQMGPLRYSEFREFLPDRSPVPERKALFLLAHLVRLYIGPDFDFDVQLILRAQDIPKCTLSDSAGDGPQLGRNTWVASQGFDEDADDAVFEGDEVVQVGPSRRIVEEF